jgi:signal transduction histidine kinase
MSEPVSILLVDDEARNLDVLETILGRADYRLVRAQTADEALMALLAGEFAAIVLDIQMPGTSGIELAQLIKQRKRNRDVPILFLTAYSVEERDVLRGYDVGAVDYLTKPVNPDILRSKIAVFVDLFRKTRALAAANQALELEVAERQKVEEALRQANEELEARVQERTLDLTRTMESERAARSEAERASRLKDEFLAIVSHELRTPLNAILGWAHILTEGRGDRPEMLAQGLEAIFRNARAQAHLIEDLLDMSRIVSGKIRLNLQTVALAEIVSAAVGTVTPAARAKGVDVDCSVDGSAFMAPIVRGDPERLQQVVLNLLTNAIKFTPEGGQVRASVNTAEGWAEIVVRDTGQGIPPRFLPYIFDPFVQAEASTTRRHGGLGLGLAVVSHLVALHGGTVLAESLGEGLGATFSVRLPLLGGIVAEKGTADAVSLASSAPESEAPADLQDVRLLLVEDEPDTRYAVARFLQNHGAVVVDVGSAEEALEQLWSEAFDILVSDIGMPGMDGYDLIRALRAHELGSGRRLPAVAVTAFAREEDRRRVLQEGYSEHVAKPVNTTRLLGVLRELAGKAARVPGPPEMFPEAEAREAPAGDPA